MAKRKPKGPSKLVQQGARLLGRVGGRHAVLFHCAKAGGIISVESPTERVIAQLADLDPRVISLKQQPFTLDVVSGRFFDTHESLQEARKGRDKFEIKQRHYTPDFSLALICGRRVIVEAKDERYLGDESFLGKLAVAKEIFRVNGLEFILMTMTYDPNHPLIFNANLLSSARHSSHSHLDLPSIHQKLEAHFGDKPTTLAEALSLAGVSLRDAPALILKSILSANLKAEHLSAKSKVSLAFGDLSCFELLEL